MTDMINHPPHYTSGKAKCECGRTIECIDVTRHMGFALGNAVKYVWRSDLKGSAIEDLRKAEFYIRDEIKRRESDARAMCEAQAKAGEYVQADPNAPHWRMHVPPNCSDGISSSEVARGRTRG